MRSWWRHEQANIATAVATALHHSAQRGGGVVRRPAGTEDSGNREEVEHATHYGPRAQKTPPPGERPGILAEPWPQRSDRSLRRSAGDSLPTLALSSLAGSAGEEMDLTRSVLKTEKEEEEKVQAMREEVRDRDGWNQAIGSDGVHFFLHRRTRRSVWVLPPSASRRKRKEKEEEEAAQDFLRFSTSL